VHVDIGPLPSEGALTFLDPADHILDEVQQAQGRVGSQVVPLPDDVLGAFRTYLGEWRKAADAGPEFRWAADVPTDVLEYLLHALFNLTKALNERAEQRGYREIPEEGRRFFHALVFGLLDAMSVEGDEATIAFAEELRAFWPGLGLDPPAEG
jgi:hypothetical protein